MFKLSPIPTASEAIRTQPRESARESAGESAVESTDESALLVMALPGVTKITAFTHARQLLRSMFDENGIELIRGNNPRATNVMQRVRVNGYKSPLFENYGGGESMPLSAAVFSLGGAGSYIQAHIKASAPNAASMATSIHNDHLDFSDLDAIIGMQYWAAEEVELLLAMLGRLLFPVGRFDDWQACLMLIGVGGSGKTTVTDAVINAGYTADQIGYISNTIEKNFSFEPLLKSSVVVAADVDKDLMTNLSQTDLHKMINGERVEDDQGQMTRRIVYFDFSKKPPFANSQLAAELKDPLVQLHILLRCTKIYRAMAERYKYDGIMPNILAKYYPRRAAVASRVQQDNDPLVHFISELLVNTPGRRKSI
ncbi:hypothetical protein T492DRAFT_885826 [Pavlovales sp. CCMP2436]|nr:hypothetical protein T492DRAFT_885826 [Pavlovales sp. CCMP2436]